MIFITGKDGNFEFGMGTVPGKLYESIEFEGAILYITCIICLKKCTNMEFDLVDLNDFVGQGHDPEID